MMFSKLTVAALVALVAHSSAQKSLKGRGEESRKANRVLKRKGNEGPKANLNECKNFVFHQFMKGGTHSVVFEGGPFTLVAYCEEPKGGTTPGPRGTNVELGLETYDEFNDLLIFGESINGGIRGGVIEDHVLPAGTLSEEDWFEEEHVGNGFSRGGGHGAVMTSTAEGKFSYFSVDRDTTIGIHEDDYDLRSFIPGIDCVVAGTVCAIIDEKTSDSDVVTGSGRSSSASRSRGK